MEQADPKAQDHVAGNRVMDLPQELEVARKERNTDPNGSGAPKAKVLTLIPTKTLKQL